MADKMKCSKLSPIRIKTREVKKNFQRNFNDGFPLGPRLFQIACEGTYKIYSYRVELRKSRKERKFSGNRWKELKKISGGAGKQEENEATVAEKDDVLWYEREKLRKTGARERWLGDTWPEYLPVFLLPITAVARSTGAIHSLDVHTCHEAESKRVAMEALN